MSRTSHRHPPARSTPRALLNRAVDARFWAQARYKSGRPLDMKDPGDRAMAKVWRDIFLAVQNREPMKRKGLPRNTECRHPASVRHAMRVGRDGSLAWKKLGTCRASNVVLDWCERCGSVLVKLPGGRLVRHWPVARIQVH